MPAAKELAYTFATHRMTFRFYRPGELSADDVLVHLSKVAASNIVTGLDAPVEMKRELREILIPKRVI